MHKSRDKGFANGDAVVINEAGFEGITGVVSEIYDDVVEVQYFDTESGTVETMEFHETFVESVI